MRMKQGAGRRLCGTRDQCAGMRTVPEFHLRGNCPVSAGVLSGASLRAAWKGCEAGTSSRDGISTQDGRTTTSAGARGPRPMSSPGLTPTVPTCHGGHCQAFFLGRLSLYPDFTPGGRGGAGGDGEPPPVRQVPESLFCR